MKAAIYIRVSTDREEQESSLVNQRQFFEGYVKERGWDIFNIYVDVESGTKRNRKSLQQLIADGKQRKFDIILAKEFSRIARNQIFALEIKEMIETYKIHLITMDGAINTLEGSTNMFGLYAWIYEHEARQTSERIKMAFKTMARNGRFKGSVPPYGYKVQDGKLVISDDGTADVVRRIFKRYLEGKGFDAIARELFNEGVKTPSQVANKRNASPYWNGSTVRLILENPNYTGDLVQGRTSMISVTSRKRQVHSPDEYIVVKNAHEPIIPRDVFETVQQLIASRRRKSVDRPDVTSRAHENVHLFTGILFCADCGAAFHYKKNRSGYICGRYNKHGSKACSDHHILEDALISIIRDDLTKFASTFRDEQRYALIKERFRKYQNKLKKDLQACKNKIEAIYQAKNKALSKFIEEQITKEAYDLFVAEKDKELKELSDQKAKLESALSESLDEHQMAKIKEVIDHVLNFQELTREAINRFIERIEVKADGTVRLFYRFSASSQVLNELISLKSI